MRIVFYAIACGLLGRHFHSLSLAWAILIFVLAADLMTFRLIKAVTACAAALERIARK